MKKLMMILALATIGVLVTSAFSDDSSSTAPLGQYGRICSPPAC